MNLDINMFGQTIKSGYIIQVSAWENDADDYTYNVLSGLTKKEVEFYKEWLPMFESNNSDSMGNQDFNFKKAIKALFTLRDKYLAEIDSQLDIDLYDVDDIDIAIADPSFVSYNTDLLYNGICGLLGDPVQYNDDFVRVFDGLNVYLLKEDITIPKLKKVKSI